MTIGSIFLKLVYPLVNSIRARWIWNRGKRYFVHGKLDPVKVAWIIGEKEKHILTTVEIAGRMGVSSVWVKKLWRRYRIDLKQEKLPELRKPGRKMVVPSEEEIKIIQEAYAKYEVNALTLEKVIDSEYRKHIPHNRIHRAMRSLGLALNEPRKHSGRNGSDMRGSIPTHYGTQTGSSSKVKVGSLHILTTHQDS